MIFADVRLPILFIPHVADFSLKLPSPQPPHHRVFWREETTSTSLWEGTQRAIEALDCQHVSAPSHQSDTKETSFAEIERQNEGYFDPVGTIREIAKFSDLQRLSRLLAARKINPACPETFAVALQSNNPAIVEMILHYGRDCGGPQFTRNFRSMGNAGSKYGSPRCLPLHASCQTGSPEILSVLFRFMVECYSREDRKEMANAQDLNGRRALHLASWSPRPQCPGKRHTILRLGDVITFNWDISRFACG